MLTERIVICSLARHFILTFRAANIFFLLKEHMSYQDTILVRQNKLWVLYHFYSSYHEMIYDKKSCLDIMSDHSWDFIRHEQILVSQCPITDCYLQPGIF